MYQRDQVMRLIIKHPVTLQVMREDYSYKNLHHPL